MDVKLNFQYYRKLLLLSFLLIHSLASSQNWEEAFLLSEKAISQEKFEKAKNILIANKSTFDGDSLKSVYFQQLGYIEYLASSYTQAITSLKHSVQFCRGGHCVSEHEFFNYFLMGKAYYELGEYNKSEYHLTSSLEIWETYEENRHDLLIPLLDQLSKLFFTQKRYSKLEESLSILEEVFKTDEGHTVEQSRFCSYKAFIEFYHGNISQALDYAKIGIGISTANTDQIQSQLYLIQAAIKFIKGERLSGESSLDQALSMLGDLEFDYPFSDLLKLSTGYFYHYNGDDKTAINELEAATKSQLATIQKYSYELLLRLQLKYKLSVEARRVLSYISDNNKKLSIAQVEIDRYEVKILMTEGRINEALSKYRAFNDYTEEDVDNYASILVEVGQYKKAKELYIDKLDELEKKSGKGSKEYLTLLNNLGILYLQLEEFPEAEYILSNSLKISKESFGDRSAQFANAANNLGTLYFEIGNYEASVNYLSISKELYAQLFSKESEAYLTLQNNIAILYSAIGDHETSIEILSSILKVEKRLLGESSLNYLTTLNNLIKERINNSDYKIALNTVDKAIPRLRQVSFGQKELTRAYFLKGLASFELTSYKKAIQSFEKAIKKHEEANDIKTKDFAVTLFKLAECHAFLGEEEKAWKLFDRSISIFNQSIDRVFSFSSEKEKEKYLKTVQEYYDLYNYYLTSHFNNKDLIASRLFEQSSFRKGILFRSSVKLRNAVFDSQDEKLVQDYYQWISVKKKISQGIGFNDEEKMKSLEVEANQLEKELNQRVSIQQDIEKQFSASVLQNELKNHQAVVDMIRYYNPHKDGYFYGCLLFIGNEEPEFIELSSEESIIEKTGDIARNDRLYVNGLYGDEKSHVNDLYNLIWSPVADKLNQIKQVYVSPTGVLHKVSFDALGGSADSLLADKWEIRYVSDISQFDYINSSSIGDIQNIGLFGGIKYSTEKAQTEYWSYLPGTKEEVENIESILSLKYNVDKYLGLSASEENFKRSAEQYEVLHIATHGFFFPDQQILASHIENDKEVVEDVNFRTTRKKAGLSMFTENNNPLIRSGIAMAKANDLSNPDRYYSQEDGVLTAFEVSQMNLSKNKLVVLSACETGVGEIRGNEGVYGLERAFKMQGVPNLIISLWQVPDQETKEFMSLFYKSMVEEELTIVKAFKSAQKIMRAKYPPYYWAAFKLVE